MDTNKQTSPTNRRHAAIYVDNITKSFSNGRQKAEILHGISFQAEAASMTVIVGPSGSGKTTLLRIVGGLSKPSKGTVTIGSTKLYSLSDRKLSTYRNDSIGFIFQDYRLLPQYNAIENVMVPLKIAGLSRSEQKKRALDALMIVGLTDYKHQKVDRLSGGQQQRVSIARALAMKPTLLIADEPTGNLDTARGTEIINLFKLLRDRGMSIVMVTHDDHIASQADHLIRIIDGNIKEELYAK